MKPTANMTTRDATKMTQNLVSKVKVDSYFTVASVWRLPKWDALKPHLSRRALGRLFRQSINTTACPTVRYVGKDNHKNAVYQRI
jgi:hypothetical protein